MSEQTPTEIEQAAAVDVQRADDTLAALEERVLDDDQTITPQEIEQARSARHFSGLRQRAAQKRAAKLREQALTAEREQALADAAAILAEADDGAVEAAVKAAGLAMLKVRETVRARNESRERALRRLQASPVVPVNPEVGGTRGVPEPTFPDLGYGRAYGGTEILWLNGQRHPLLDEDAVMDRARKHPAALDAEAKHAEYTAGAARLLEADKTLYRADRAAFDALPAHRRKPALDALGVDWNAYCEQREQDLMRRAQGA